MTLIKLHINSIYMINFSIPWTRPDSKTHVGATYHLSFSLGNRSSFFSVNYELSYNIRRVIGKAVKLNEYFV
jgi:hypothetical protein